MRIRFACETNVSDPNYPTSIKTAAGARSVPRRFVRDLWMRPRWHRVVLVLAALAAGLGWAHWSYQAATATSATTAPAVTVRSVPPPPPPSSPFFAPLARRVGGSILLGFVIGWMFRTFVRLMAAITALAVGSLALLSHFHIMNVDLTAAENKTSHASVWVTDQAGRLRDAALAHVHSTIGGAVGLFMGVRRPRI